MTKTSATHLADFRAAVHAGLSQTPKTLPCRFFYDLQGSLLFEQICELPDYYLTRTEDAILRERADEIAAAVPADVELVELGSGSSRKTRRLLQAFLRRQRELRYTPVDISAEMLAETARALAREFPRLTVTPLAAEYYEAMERLRSGGGAPRLVLFLGSNLGNFTAEDAARFLACLREMLGPADHALLGLDLKKAPEVLEAAYDDAGGVTAQFNLNLLVRLQRELGGDVDLDGFRHRALYNEAEGRVEMHLVSVRPQTIRLDGREYRFAAGETIHTENSHKYSLPQIRGMARAARLDVARTWQDADGLFSLHLFAPAGP